MTKREGRELVAECHAIAMGEPGHDGRKTRRVGEIAELLTRSNPSPHMSAATDSMISALTDWLNDGDWQTSPNEVKRRRRAIMNLIVPVLADVEAEFEGR